MTLLEFLSDRLGRLALQLICIGLAALFLFATGTQPGVLIILLFVLLLIFAAAQIYDFSRLVSQDYKLSLHRVDVCRLLRETFLEHYLLLERSCLRPECRLPDRPLYVSGDSSALERIFSNLFQNAGRYGEHFLNIQWEETPGEIKISFTNDTCSLTSSEAACLFDRFYMQDPARTQGGTGLGLTIAKSLAEAMNGTPEENLEREMMVKEGFDRLLKVVQDTARQRVARLEGQILDALVEEVNEQDSRLLTGRLSNNTIVHFPGDKSLIGRIVPVYLKECHGFYYLGEKR